MDLGYIDPSSDERISANETSGDSERDASSASRGTLGVFEMRDPPLVTPAVAVASAVFPS